MNAPPLPVPSPLPFVSPSFEKSLSETLGRDYRAAGYRIKTELSEASGLNYTAFDVFHQDKFIARFAHREIPVGPGTNDFSFTNYWPSEREVIDCVKKHHDDTVRATASVLRESPLGPGGTYNDDLYKKVKPSAIFTRPSQRLSHR